MDGEGKAFEYPQQRVVVLGASNVARGVCDVAEVARGFHGVPLDLILAAGHGRSFGTRSSVLWRSLPGLTQCGLWEALRERPQGQQVSAAVTDVGNDLLYGQQPETILAWVNEAIEQLVGEQTRLVVVELPLSSLKTLGRLRFWAAKSALFPSSPLAFEGFLDKCLQLNDGLRQIAARQAATLIAPSLDWYGFDPVHIRRRMQRRAWEEIFAPLKVRSTNNAARFSRRERAQLKRVRHASRKWFGRVETREQPAAFLTDTSIVSMY